MRDRRAIAVSVALAVAFGLLIAGCGGSGPIASQSPDRIVRAATSAIDGVHSVRVTGSVDGARSGPIALDLHLVAGKGATGSMSENGVSFRLVAVGKEAYINGSPSFWRQFAGPSAARRLQGRWLRAPAGSGEFASFSSLTDLHTLLSQLLSNHGKLVKAGHATIAGRDAVALRDADRQGTLYVSAKGTPYPLRLANSGSSGGRLDFSQFDAPVALRAPAASIDITSLHK